MTARLTDDELAEMATQGTESGLIRRLVDEARALTALAATTERTKA